MLSLLMLICAVMASLALGVLVAYGLCVGMFSVFLVHARSAARQRSVAAPVITVALKS